MLILVIFFSLLINNTTLGQDTRIGIVDTSYINENATLQKWIIEDVNIFFHYLKDSILSFQQEQIEVFYEKIMVQSQSCHWLEPFYEVDIQRELQEWQDSLISLTKLCEKALIEYELKLLDIKNTSIDRAIDSLVKGKNLEYVIYSEGVLFCNESFDQYDSSKEIVVELNKGFVPEEWILDLGLIKEKLLVNLRLKRHFKPTRVRMSDVYTYEMLREMFIMLYYFYRIPK